MKTEFQPGRAKQTGQNLLDLSRDLRRFRSQTEDLRRNLRRIDDMDIIRRELDRQIEQMETETVWMVKLSTALMEIAERYSRTEERNTEIIDGGRASAVAGCYADTANRQVLHRRINSALY